MIISIIVRHPLLEIPSCRSGPKAEREIHLTFLLFGQEQDKSGRTYLCGLLHSALCACANKHPRNTSDCQEGGRGGEYVVVLFQGGRCSLSTDFSMFIKNGRVLLINSFCGWMVHANFNYKTSSFNNIHYHRSWETEKQTDYSWTDMGFFSRGQGRFDSMVPLAPAGKCSNYTHTHTHTHTQIWSMIKTAFLQKKKKVLIS